MSKHFTIRSDDKRIRSGRMMVDPGAEARLLCMMEGFRAQAALYPRPRQLKHSSKYKRHAARFLAAAERVKKAGLLLTRRALADEMRISYYRLHGFLMNHPDIKNQLNLKRHPHGMPTRIRSQPA